MPYALCPMPYARRVPHLSEKGYISIPVALIHDIEDTAIWSVPTENNIVGTRHCRVLILANNSDATGNDIN